MTINRVQEGLAGFLALDSNDLKQPIQLVLGLRNFFDHPQLLGVQEVEHVIKNRLQVAGVQAHLSQHCVLLFFGNKGAFPAQRGRAAGSGVTAKEGLRLIHEEALVLVQRGRFHRQERGILKFRVGAGDRAGAERAGVHGESQLVSVQLWKETSHCELQSPK